MSENASTPAPNVYLSKTSTHKIARVNGEWVPACSKKATKGGKAAYEEYGYVTCFRCENGRTATLGR